MSLAFVACKKEQASVAPTSAHVAADPNDVFMIAFSKTLAKTVKAEPAVRSFIKAEAARMFDNDYDILYQAAKDKKLANGQTLHETLLKYADDAEGFRTASEQLPLLTIYVPELPNFSAERWNAETQIPQVAIKQADKAGTSIYDAEGKETVLENKYIPGFPLLVVKSNERVVNANAASDARLLKNVFYSNARYSFAFLDDAFDGSKPKKPAASTERLALSMDQTLIDAYNSGIEWHRDYIYYGITPTNTIGKFTNRYSEFITSFAFTKPEHLGLISTHENDPKAVTNNTLRRPYWIDGRFEIRISIFLNSKNAVGQELRKYFTATGPELFNLEYDSTRVLGNIYVYHFTQATPRAYNPNIEIVPWDLEQYGSVWKFVVSEYDPAEEITRTVTNTTTYGANFELNVSTGEKLKIGGKFGASTTTQHTESYQYKTTYGSQDLAEGVLDFRYPVITAIGQIVILIHPLTIYLTHEVSTGIVTFSVEPKKIY
jgi:hypothetical protein